MSSIKTIRSSLTDFLVKEKPEKENSHFLTLKNYKKVAFLDTISRLYTHLEEDVDKLRAKFQLEITTNY